MKAFKGKAIYNPSGKAGEYSYWACNFYVGCSNGCTYCYLKTGPLAATMGGNKPLLKKCFKDEVHALQVFEQEMKTNLAELQKHGLFFSFTTDPMLPETYHLTLHAIGICCNNFIPVKILTKCTEWINDFDDRLKLPQDYKLIAFGFTLTGHDELEPVASTNAERIEAMEKLHNSGFKTFASIEPIIDFDSSYEMILRSQANCDLFKIGLKSGEKYLKHQVIAFVSSVNRQCESVKIYWKDSLLKAAGINRDDLSANCVTRNYNLFK